MFDQKLVEDTVHALDIEGGCTKRRPVHTVGIGAQGFFVPSPVAKNYCIAKHFDLKCERDEGTGQLVPRKVPVDVRFSNGMGVVKRHDGWSDVRGMAVRFYLGEDKSTDLVAMTLPVFFAPDPQKFNEFAWCARPKPCSRESIWQKIKDYLRLQLPMPDPYPGQTERPNENAINFANGEGHTWAQPAVVNASVIGAPKSYVRAAYHAVHTFIVTGKDKEKRYVRFTWAPIAGVLNKQPNEPVKDRYLQGDLRRRLSCGKTERFSLIMHIGEMGDDFNDSTRQWPPHRKRVMMGTLTLTHFPNRGGQRRFEKMSFNPWDLTDGIAPSNDPILRFRKDVYEFSSNRRCGTPCPFNAAKGVSHER